MKKLTIIIPCYNASQYIEECLNSILPYMDASIELLIINDGSTDNSLAIITDIANQYPQHDIQIINQKNHGISYTRNQGILKSSAQYITFLDADDYYSPEFWIHFPKLLDSKESDIFEYHAQQFEAVTGKQSLLEIACFEGDHHITQATDYKRLFEKCHWYTWARVFKRELLINHDLSFPAGNLCEDAYFTPLAYLHAHKITAIKQPLLHYRENSSSMTKTFRESDITDLINVLGMYKRIPHQLNDPKLKKVIQPTIAKIFRFLKHTRKNNSHPVINFNDSVKLYRAIIPFVFLFPASKWLSILTIPIHFTYIPKVTGLYKRYRLVKG